MTPSASEAGNGEPTKPVPRLRADKRNSIGAAPRPGNKHPGQGRASGAGSIAGAPHASRVEDPFGKAFPATPATSPPTPATSPSAAGVVARAEAERDAGKKVFTAFMTTQRREEILEATFKQATLGNVPAARLLLAYDLGNPVSTSELVDKTALKGAEVRKAIKDAVAAAEQEVIDAGGNVVAFRNNLNAGIWAPDAVEEAE